MRLQGAAGRDEAPQVVDKLQQAGGISGRAVAAGGAACYSRDKEILRDMNVGIRQAVTASVAMAMMLAAVSPAIAATAALQRKHSAFDAPGEALGIGSFTPAAADPRAAASFARAGVSRGGFRFTPSATLGSRRAVTVAVRARAPIAADRLALAPPLSAIAPSAYNLGVAIGWKRFALSGDVTRIDTGVLPGSRDLADVALSFGGRRWSTRLQFGADRATGETLRVAGIDQSYSLDLGGSYSLTRRLDVTGGVRYRVQHDGLDRLSDERRDAQSVYIGTAFRF